MIWILLSCANSDNKQPEDASRDPQYEFADAYEGAKSYAGEGVPPPSAPGPMDDYEPVEERFNSMMELGGALGAKGNQPGLGGLGTKGSGRGGGGTAKGSGMAIEEETVNVRSWFPETFIFEPLIETDDNGHANHAFTVPDRLTTWRILGLAHTQSGLSSGSTHEILGTLPQYIDPSIPPFMRVNDQIKIPILSINTTSEQIKGQIKAEALGGTLSKSNMALTLSPYNTQRSETVLTAKEAGTMDVRFSLKGIDTVKEKIKVVPLGQKKTSIENGILNGEHQFNWRAPKTAISNSNRLQLSIYPGAIGFFRSELRRSLNNDVYGNVYSIIMAERMKALALKMEMEESFDALDRKTEQAAQQLYFNLSGNLVNEQNVFLLEAFLTVKDNLVMHRIGVGMANRIADTQLPDGTFPCSSTLYPPATTVQQHLVNMAKSAMVFRRIAELEPSLSPKTDRVIELINQGIPRLWKQHSDAYTAAWLIVAGLGSEAEQKEWKSLVKDALTQTDGLWQLTLPEGVKAPGGAPPTQSEFQALASVIFVSDAPISNNLISQVMTSYNPQYGWGDTLRNEIIFHCMTQNISQALPEQITLSIFENDQKIATTVVQKESLQDLVYIEVSLGESDTTEWRLEVDPPTPSMSFGAAFTHYEPIKSNAKEKGLGFEWKRPSTATANQPIDVPLTLSLPRMTPFTLNLSLPSGVKITSESKQNLAQYYTVNQTDESLTISGRTSDSSLTTIDLKVMAQFKGRISGGAHVLETGSIKTNVAPQVWTIK